MDSPLLLACENILHFLNTNNYNTNKAALYDPTPSLDIREDPGWEDVTCWQYAQVVDYVMEPCWDRPTMDSPLEDSQKS